MTEYIISEEQAMTISRVSHRLVDPILMEISNRPLSEHDAEIRNKLIVEMLAAIPNEGMAVWEERGYLKFINSFRSEP
jgi:hypothetical protein